MDLRANTAVDVLIGPFVANDDGDTVDDGLTIVRADVLLSKKGQGLTQKANTSNAGNDSFGYYNCPLATGDTDEEGNLALVVHKTGTLPVRHEFNVMAEAAWDSLYAPKDTGFMDVNTREWNDTSVTLGNGRPDVNVDSIDDVLVSTVATAGKLHVFDDAGASIPTVGENQSGLAPAGEYDTELDTNIASRAPAGEYNTQLDANMSSRAPSGEYDTELANIETDTGQIGTAGAGLSDLGGMSDGMKAEVQVEADEAIVANHLDHLLKTEYDPASKPGSPVALLNELIGNDGGVSQYTANALELAPAGGGGGDATEAKQDSIIATLGTPANIDTGGATIADNLKKLADDGDGLDFDATTDSQEAIRDNQSAGGGTATEAKQDAIIATLGTPANIDTGGATIADNLKKIADDGGGLNFDAETDSLKKQVTVLPVDANLIQINGATGPADALEDQYDGTGLTGDTFPANQAQLGQIALTGAAVNTPTDSAPNGWANTWGEETLDEDSTHALDGTYHDIEAENDTTEKIDGYYIFDIGGAGVPTSVTFTGYLTTGGGAAKSIIVEAWNGSGWDQIGEIASGTSSSVNTFTLFTTHVTSKKVWIRFSNGAVAYSATTTLKTDQIYVSYAVVSQTVGYANGAVWIDTEHGNSGVELYVNGTADNPVDTLASAMTIAEALNIHRFEVTAGSILQFIEDMTGWVFNGSNYTIDFNGQNSDSLLLIGATVSNELTSTGAGVGMIQCRLSDGCTIPAGGYKDCTLPGDIILGGPFYIFNQCISAVAGTGTPSIDFVNENVSKSVNFRSYSGGIEVRNFGHGTATHTMSLEGDGQLIFNSSCSNADAGDVIAIRGNFTITDNVGGGWGGTISDEARFDQTQILDAVIDDATRIDGSSVNAVEGDVATLQTSVDGVPTTSEFNARTLPSADYLVEGDTLAAVTAVADVTGDVKGNVDGTVTGKTPAEAGDNMNLADNAIKAAKFDQSTAHPMANADGSDLTEVGGDGAQLTEAGGDGDHLVEAGGDGDHLVEAGGTGDQLSDLGGMSTGMKGEVNAEVVDTLNVDTYDEPGDEELAVDTTLVKKIGYLYKFLRNKIVQTETKQHVYNAAEDNIDQSADVSDDGSEFIRGEFGAGD